jgi:tetratricopeptide (TPR) repeat protein
VSEDGQDELATKREAAAPLHRAIPGLDRGSMVGRYVILDVVGQGGMGVVYSAYDPELDRKVAIKLLQASSGGSSSGGQAWLVREAQAMARLSHPNVIAVHDVGVLPGDRMFVAMELVEGDTLRTWLKTPHTWREVLEVMRAAGAGLAAAHAVGLVHRDFKPENVLIGADGRVRVMDFGLARLRPDDEPSTPASRNSDLDIEARSPLSEQLTEAGTVMGTPAYMAPEVHDGAGASVRSDQFAFGVALYEALYRDRPFDKQQLVAPRDTVPKPKPPPDLGIPARIQRAVMRAIAIESSERFATMDDLLAELAYDPLAGRRRVAIGAAAGMVAIAITGGVYAMTRTRVERGCTGAEPRLAGVWDAAVKQAVRAGFGASKKPYAASSYAALERALDGYMKEWSAATVGNCEATHVRHEQSEQVQMLRQSCLDQQLEEVRVLTDQLKTPSDALVERADKVVLDTSGGGLPPISQCANVIALALPDRPSEADRAKYDELQKQIAFARGQAIAGMVLPALTSASKVEAGAKLIHSEGLEADALLVRGGALTLAGNIDDALAALDRSTWAAMRARRDDIVAQAALSAAIANAEQRSSPDVAEMWLKLSQAAATRVGIDKLLATRALQAQGVIEADRGQLKQAVATHQKALAAAEAAYGPDSPALWQSEEVLAASMSKAGAWVDAIPHFERSLKLRESAVGPDHPDVALIVSNLGACYDHAGDGTRALALFQRALRTREKIYGPNSPFLIATLNNLADFEMHNGDPASALVTIERARAIAEKAPGKASSIYHIIATTRAEVLGTLGKVAEARTAFDEIIAFEIQLKSPELGTTLAARGALELRERAWAAAAGFEERSIAAYEASDKDHLELWRPLAGLATAKRALDPKADVKPLLERAIAIGEKAQLKAADLQPIKDALAR